MVANGAVSYGAGAIVRAYRATTYEVDDPGPGGESRRSTRRAPTRRIARAKDGSVVDKARRVCVPDGVPRVLATPYPFEIFQVPVDHVTFLYEMNHQVRVIFMDRPLPSAESLIVDPRYNGHSVGHWDGDTLVVESAGFNDRTFLDASGLPHSDEMTTVELIRRVGIQLEGIITIHDPEMYARDWQARFVYDARNDVRLEDYACNDHHRDLLASRAYGHRD
jgi:hypothetical protein